MKLVELSIDSRQKQFGKFWWICVFNDSLKGNFFFPHTSPESDFALSGEI